MKTIISLSNTDSEKLSTVLGKDCPHLNTAKVTGGTEHVFSLPNEITPGATLKFVDSATDKFNKEFGKRVAATYISTWHEKTVFIVVLRTNLVSIK